MSRQGTPMYAIGAVILVLVVLWMGFMAADGVGLDTREGRAVVVAKSYRAAGKTYTTEIVAGRSKVVPHATPEMYLLDLELSGERVRGATDRKSFESAQAGDTMHVRYQRRRFTGRTQVVSLSRK